MQPEDSTTYHNRGLAKSRLGQIEDEIKDYDKAIALDPQYASA